MDSAPTPRSRACFHARPAGFVPEDRPLALSSQVHLSTAKSSSEFLRDHQPARGLSARARLTGSRPSSRHHRAASTHRGWHPALRYVPSSGFLSLSTACSATQLGRPVPSCRHVQGSLSPFRGFSPAAAGPPSSGSPCPHAVTGAALTQANPSCHAITASTSRPSSASDRVARLRGLAVAALAPLFGFRSLRDQPFHPWTPGSPRVIRPRRSSPQPSVARWPVCPPSASIPGETRRNPSPNSDLPLEAFCLQNTAEAAPVRPYAPCSTGDSLTTVRRAQGD